MEDLVLRNRSYRRFHQDRAIPYPVLEELIDLARLSPSSRNAQPLKYFVANQQDTNGIIFRNLAWAGYLTDWPGPEEGEQPSAYIIILEDKSIGEGFQIDYGIAAQTIMLGATHKGFGGCIVGSVRREQLAVELKLPQNLSIALVLALGYPKERVKLHDIEVDGDIKYWRGKDGTHHVPKRKLKDIIVPHSDSIQ